MCRLVCAFVVRKPEDRFSRLEAQMSFLHIQSFLFHTLYSLCFTHYTVSAPFCYSRQYSWLRICYFFSWLKGWWMVPGSSLQQPYYTEIRKQNMKVNHLFYRQMKMPAKYKCFTVRMHHIYSFKKWINYWNAREISLQETQKFMLPWTDQNWINCLHLHFITWLLL